MLLVSVPLLFHRFFLMVVFHQAWSHRVSVQYPYSKLLSTSVLAYKIDKVVVNKDRIIQNYFPFCRLLHFAHANIS